MSPQARMTLTRRTAWSTALAGTALLAGCDLSAEDEPAPPATTADAGEPDADTGLVTTAADEVAATLVLVVAVSERYPRLRRDLAGLERMHDEHLGALGSAERSGPEVPTTRDAAAALALVRRRELAHQRRLVEHAVAARSGQLAGLLASMSAAVAQQLTFLPTRAGR